MSNIKAAIITIGDELLIGQTIDTNSAYIAQQLNVQGIDVMRRVAVGDTRDAIWNALDAELAEASLVIITGGLGPTADDITKPLLNAYFGGKMVVDEAVLAHVMGIFARRNRPFLESNRKQAEVPDVCTVLFNKMGTAPGMWFDKDERVVIALPGVPFEMIGLMQNEVLPRLASRFTSDALLHRSIVTAGEGESFVAERIRDLEEALPAHIRLAYLPGPGMVKLRLTGRSSDKAALTAELDGLQSVFAARLHDIVVALEDIPLEEAIGNLLKQQNKTLGLAESCTAGNIAHCMTQVAHSSDYFRGGIVCYHKDVKIKLLGVNPETIDTYNVVSKETATEMAFGALSALGTDYALSITGLLDKGGETPEIPVGTIWIAVTDGTRTVTYTIVLPSDRKRNKELATSFALLQLWKFLNVPATTEK